MRPFNDDNTWGDKQKKIYHFDEQGNKIYDPKKRQYKCNKIQTTDWNEQTKAEVWRAAWAECCNQYLERGNHADRIDHRSFERQVIEQVPTIHLGVAASQMERRGIRTERGDMKREIEINNQRLREIKARISKLQVWLKEEMQNTEPPTLADVISNTLTWKQGYYNSAHGLKRGAEILNFLTANKIADMAGLVKVVDTLSDKRSAILDELKKVERRAETLDEHLKQSAYYKSYRSYKMKYEKLYAEYTSLKKVKGFGAERKAQKSLTVANEYYENNRDKILGFENAERYLKDVLQKHFDPAKLPPITKWTAEREKLHTEHLRINSEYQRLKSDTAAVAKIRSNVIDVISMERRREQPQRSRSQELEI